MEHISTVEHFSCAALEITSLGIAQLGAVCISFCALLSSSTVMDSAFSLLRCLLCLKSQLLTCLQNSCFFYYLALNHTLKIPLMFQHEVVNGFTFLRRLPKIASISFTIYSRSMLPFSVRTASLRLTTEEWSKWGAR